MHLIKSNHYTLLNQITFPNTHFQLTESIILWYKLYIDWELKTIYYFVFNEKTARVCVIFAY